MSLFRFGVLAALGYGIYEYAIRARAKDPNGLRATFDTRERADLAVEHLVQEHGVDRSAIFVEPVDDENSAGIRVSGGDAASGRPGSTNRDDAPLRGQLYVTVATTRAIQGKVRDSLEVCGAVMIETIT